tara:strand:- start:396 stop:980 length:585 start_codon:yes stop_codon:yes gene_type:complete
MKLLTTLLSIISLASAAVAWTTALTTSTFSRSFQLRSSIKGIGMDNGYVAAPGADGGQGQFGARSPSEWKQPGTSPFGESSYDGQATHDEPWAAEAVGTVFMDLEKGRQTLEAFTLEAQNFKIEVFAKTNPEGYTNVEAAKKRLIDDMGWDDFMNASPKQMAAGWLGPEGRAAVAKAEKDKKAADAAAAATKKA